MSRNPESLATSAFDYALPADRIARYPAARRDESRLLVLDRRTGRIEHRIFRDIIGFMEAGDVLVLNETRVFPGRLSGRKPTGARAEILLLHPDPGESFDSDYWTALVKPGARLRAGAIIDIAADFRAEILEVNDDGTRRIRLRTRAGVEQAIREHGHVPLPPYIGRPDEPDDSTRYQTVYAKTSGSVAAPTAGLHFTAELLDGIAGRGVDIARIVLHVGPGTFRPVETEDPAEHAMHAEPYDVPQAAADSINAARERGGRVWAVGTTVVRTLESVADEDGRIAAGRGSTKLFLRPGDRFRAIDRLITNFHLPRSTLLMLVAAFAGYDAVMQAYGVAVAEGYRFYSYGDAMAIL